MTENVVHTIVPGASLNEGYFDYDNIQFIQEKIAEVLQHEFSQTVIVTHNDIIRTMQFVLGQRRENVPRMNQRVIMYITNDFRTHQLDVNRKLNWEEGYVSSQRRIDFIGGTSQYDHRAIKLTDTKKANGHTKVGGTLRFHFT